MVLSEDMQQRGARLVCASLTQVCDVDGTTATMESDGDEVVMVAWDKPGDSPLTMIADCPGILAYLVSPKLSAIPIALQPGVRCETTMTTREIKIGRTEVAVRRDTIDA